MQQRDTTGATTSDGKIPNNHSASSGDKLLTHLDNGNSSSSSGPLGLPDVNSDRFNMGIGGVIVANAVVIGFETDLPENAIFTVMEHAFNVIFVCEMFLRLSSMRLRYFSEAWNLFDCTLVVTGSLDLWIFPLMTGTHKRGGVASLMRLLRILRILRVIRIFRMFRELTLIAQAFINAFSSVCWIGTLVIIVDYICAVFLTRTLGHKASEWGDEHEEDIEMWFGSIGSSMYTLFMIMTLAEWDRICSVAMKEYPGVIFFFIAYILVASYTMVSLITGVISESLITAQREDETNKIKSIEEGRRGLKYQLQRIFELMDTDGSGTISPDEIQEVILHSSNVTKKLDALDIQLDSQELLEIYNTILHTQKLVQGEESIQQTEIPIADFVTAMAAIRGQASMKETFLMRQEIKALTHRQDEMCHMIQTYLERAEHLEQSDMVTKLREDNDMKLPVNPVPMAPYTSSSRPSSTI